RRPVHGDVHSREHLLQHPLDLTFQLPDLRLDLFQRPQRSILVEVPSEWDLVTDLSPRLIDPRIRNKRPDLALEVLLDVLLERHIFGVAQIRVGLRRAPGCAHVRILIALAERCDDGAPEGSADAYAGAVQNLLEIAKEVLAIEVDALGIQRTKCRPDRLLRALALLDLLPRLLPFLPACRQVLERGLVLQSRDALRRRLETQAQGALHGDLSEPEVVVVEDPGVLRLRERAVDLGDLADVIWRKLVALIAERLPHLSEESDTVHELDPASTLRALPVRDDPHVRVDAGVVEELVGQSDNRLEPVIFDDPATDLALAASGIAGEQRRSIEDDRDTAPAFLRGAHLRDHVLEEEERPIVDPRGAGAEAACEAERVALVFDDLLHLPPGHAERRVRQHVVEPLTGVAVGAERVAEDDVLGVLPLDEHVRLTDRVALLVQLLPEDLEPSLRVHLAQEVLRYGEHTAGAGGRIIQRLHHAGLP